MQRRPKQCGSVFYNDMDESSQEYWASNFEPISIRNHPLPVSNACWDLDIPKIYIRTIKDEANPIKVQDRMIQKVQTGYEKDWTLVTMNCGHSPFLSRITELTDILENSARMYA